MFSKKNVYIALAVVLLLGAFLRFYRLGNNSFVADEFLDINSTYAYFKTGEWQNWDFNFGRVNTENEFTARDERAWTYKWQVAQLFNFFPPTEAVARTVSALWGTLTIVLLYATATYFSKKKTIGLLSAFLFAISPSAIEFDRHLRMYAMFLPVYLVFSWLLFHFLEGAYTGKIGFMRRISKKWHISPLFLIPALLAGILSLAVHQLTASIAFTILGYIIFWTIFSYRKERRFATKYGLALGTIIAGLVLGIIFFPHTLNMFYAGLEFFNNHWGYVGIALSDYVSPIIAIGLLLLGIYFLYRKQNLPAQATFVTASFLLPLFTAILLWRRNVGDQYIFFIKPFIIILIASGIYFSARFFKERFSQQGTKAYAAAILISLLILPSYGYFFQKDNAYNQTSDSSNPNYRKVFAYFKKNQQSGDVLITRNFRNYYWSGAHVHVFDFGGELAKEKLSLEDVKKITTENKSGWFIFSDNDESYIANDAITYAEKNFEKVSNVNVRGNVTVFHWKE